MEGNTKESGAYPLAPIAASSHGTQSHSMSFSSAFPVRPLGSETQTQGNQIPFLLFHIDCSFPSCEIMFQSRVS